MFRVRVSECRCVEAGAGRRAARRGIGLPLAALLAAGCVGVAWSSAAAQRPASDARKISFGVWSATAHDQPLKTRVGHTHDRDLYVVGLRATWPLRTAGVLRVEYAADLLPVVVSTRMPMYGESSGPPACPSSEPGPCEVLLESQGPTWGTVYGAGVAPLGLALRVGAAAPVSVALRGSAGLVYFTRRVPDPGERRLNFSADVGAEVAVRVTRRLTLSAGYRLDHLSNGNRGPVNPGMNSRMLELGSAVVVR